MSRRLIIKKTILQKKRNADEIIDIIDYVQEKFAYLYLEEDQLHHEIRRER